MKKLLLLVVFMAAAGCHDKPAQVTVTEPDGAKLAVSLPSGLTAKELIQLRGLADAALTVRADKQERVFALQTAQLAAQQTTAARRDYFVFLAALCALGCAFFGKRSVRP